MLLIFSSNANDSSHIKREVNLAGGRNVPIVPFRIEDVPMSDSLSYFLESPHWLDAITPPIDQHFELLAENVNFLIGRSSAADSNKDKRSPTPIPAPIIPDPRTRHGWALGAGVLFLVVVGIGIYGNWSSGPADKSNVPRPSPYPMVSPSPAATPFTEIGASFKELAASHLKKGKECSEKNDLNCAVEEFSKAISYDKTNDHAFNERGRIYYIRKQFKEALEDFSECSRLVPSDAVCLYNKGNAFRSLGDVDAAILNFAKAIEINPNYSSAYNNRGLAYLEKQLVLFAITDFEKAASIDPNDPVYKRNLESARKKAGVK